jgi:DNA invertase Pin-like site-specific DNA recombinase
MFQMMGVFAEFERSMIVERVRAGVARAKASGTKSGKAFGRPVHPWTKPLDLDRSHLTQNDTGIGRGSPSCGNSRGREGDRQVVARRLREMRQG